MPGSGKTTRVYLVRHGETDWNRERRLQGLLDVPLNEVGTAQAHRLAEYFASIPITCVVSSPLARASETAVTLSHACRCRVEIDPRLREIDHGSWSGLTLVHIGQRFPDLVRNDQLRPAAFDVSGGERLQDVSRRVSAMLTDLLARHEGESVLVVGHGITLAMMWCAANNVDFTQFADHLPPNAGVVLLTFSRGRLVEARTTADAGTAMDAEVPR